MLRYIDTVEGLPLITAAAGGFSDTVLNWINPGTTWGSSNATAGLFGVVAGLSAGTDRAIVLGSLNSAAQSARINLQIQPALTGKFTWGGLVRLGNSSSPSSRPTLATYIVRLGAVLTTTASQPNGLQVNVNGSLTMNGVTSSATGLIGPTPAYLEIECDIPGNIINVYVNGTLALTTTPSSITSVSAISLGYGAADFQVAWSWFDDMYLVDDTTGGPTARLGPSKVLRTPLGAAIGTPAFSPQGGAASNLAAVNKNTLSTTTFNQSPSTNPARDIFSVDASGIGSGDTVHGVAVRALYRKNDVGPRTLSMITGDGTVENSTVLQDNLAFATHTPIILNRAPDGTAWTQPKLAALRAGYEVNA